MNMESVGNTPSLVLDRAAFGRLGVLLLFAALHLGFVHAQEEVQAPQLIYSEVRTAQPVVAVGVEVNLEIVLLDAYSMPIAAPETYDLAVKVYRDSSAGELLGEYSVSIATGEGSAHLNIPADEIGMFSIIAVSPVLVSRELFVQVFDPSSDAVVAPYLTFLRGRSNLLRISSLAAPPLLADDTSYKLRFHYDNSVKYRANGGDRVRVQLFLFDSSGSPIRAPEDVEVMLATTGTLTPEPLVIEQGQASAIAFLRSDQVGPVQLAYVGAIPEAELEGGPLESIQFVGNSLAIRAVSLTSLIEPVKITLQLLGVDGKPFNARASRPVTVSMVAESKGKGVFKPVAETVIQQGSFQGSVTFVPTWPGAVKLRADSANLTSVDSTVEVSVALTWILISFAGGVVGALVGLLSERQAANTSYPPLLQRVLIRVFIGIVAGSLLYWAYLFGILLPPNTNVLFLHPFSAFFVTLLGAFAGIGVLSKVLRNFGFNI